MSMQERTFGPGEVIQLYGIYRCSCGGKAFHGISGRNFPAPHCQHGRWTMIGRMREEKFF